MACTTILIGKNASYDGSTIMARNDDSPSGVFTSKKLVKVEKNKNGKKYCSVISKVEVDLPEESLSYTCMPTVEEGEGIWGACGINELNVAMTATETITTNARVLGADPLVVYDKKKNIKGGIGEEDLVSLALPYIHSAREGVLRLGSLLERYGTYESNGIGFSDENEIWWLESIGGHHWIARRVKDDEYVVMPNQFGIDQFDFNDAFGKKENYLCSEDLKEFIQENFLSLDIENNFSPRLAFGSHDDSDHVYNTPRAWYMLSYFNPKSFLKGGVNEEKTPMSDDLPYSMVPERKITLEEVKYILSSHYQGTEYDCYSRFNDSCKKGAYRPIGISRTSFMAILQIRPYVLDQLKGVEWLSFGSNVFNCSCPFYTSATLVPDYYGNTTTTVSTDNLYWQSRLLGALADSHFGTCEIFIERYQNAVASASHQLLKAYDEKIEKGLATLEEANQAIANMVKEETDKALSKVLYTASCQMKNGYSRSDN